MSAGFYFMIHLYFKKIKFEFSYRLKFLQKKQTKR
jgi:hypothetical protein